MPSSRRPARQKPMSPAGHVAAVMLNVFLLWLVHSLPSRNLSVLSARFPETLWAFDLSIGVNLLANAVLIFYHPPRLRRLVQTVLNATSFIWLYTMLTVFPFQLPDAAMVALRLGILALLGVIAFMLLFDLVRLVIGQL